MSFIIGLSQLQAKLSKVSANVPDVLEKAALAGAKIGEKYTKEEAPEDTGELKNSYTTEVESRGKDGVVVVTGSNCDHAEAQEFGTSRQPGKPHLRPGFYNHTKEIEDAASKELEALFK